MKSACNYFIDLIEKDKIKNLTDLKHVYRNLLKETHPDTRGNDDQVQDFIRLKKIYLEAVDYLEKKTGNESNEDYRFLFYQALFQLLVIEDNPEKRFGDYKANLVRADLNLQEISRSWMTDKKVLVESAWQEYQSIREESYHNDLNQLRIPPLHDVISPFLYSLCRYHLTGKIHYRIQITRNHSSFKHRLKDQGLVSLEEFFLLLLSDLELGAAIMIDLDDKEEKDSMSLM